MELPAEHTFSYWNSSLNGTGYFEQPNIRVTKVPHNFQLAPTHDLDAPLTWSRASWSALEGHSAISYYFAKELSEVLNGTDSTPIGIIESSCESEGRHLGCCMAAKLLHSAGCYALLIAGCWLLPADFLAADRTHGYAVLMAFALQGVGQS